MFSLADAYHAQVGEQGGVVPPSIQPHGVQAPQAPPHGFQTPQAP
ncbi:unnamed protein product [Brassica rapa]|uniref:Uncharacterized protein n=1 Tax=Brassica campestris TaxID=3711 RepID=A0A3P5YMP6_BRACM|nr:unnamed protein product [Brassica rapa]VDC61268.1 unnamed protein product [Brassica rapa]